MFNFLISNLNIIIPIAIILLGIISVVCEKNKYQKKINNIQTYNNSICSYLSGDKKQFEFLMTKGGEIEQIVQDYVSSPVTSFVHMLYKPYNNIDSLKKEALNIHRISNQKIEEFKNKKHTLNRSFLNPFTLFYRGIGLLLKYILGYLINLFFDDFNYDGKGWKTFVGFISFISALASIMGFFEISYTDISNLF